MAKKSDDLINREMTDAEKELDQIRKEEMRLISNLEGRNTLHDMK